VTKWFALFAAVLFATPSAAQAPVLPEILVSRQLAEAEHLRVGATVRLSPVVDGSGGREFLVAGIYEPTPDPERLGQVPREVRLHLPDLLDLNRPSDMLAGAEPIDGINVTLTNPAAARAFARSVQSAMPGLVARPANESAPAGPFRVLEQFHLAIATVTIVAATVFLLALTIMLVDERRETVGILRLIGLPVRRILVQILFEGLLVAGVGAVFGLMLALLSEGLINTFFQWRYDTALVFVHISRDVAAKCIGIAVPLGAGATVCASWALLRRNGLRLARR
jgi:predicted lysophospholipase L1 biosynthesis ABC-type transport system permease subunit